MLQGKELRDTCLGSATAGMVSKFICHPVDTAKARLQMPEGAALRGTVHALRTTFAKEGVPGLYRGIGAVMVASPPGSSLYFTTYEATKEFLADRRAGNRAGGKLNSLDHFAAGMLAETVCCVIYVPCDVIKQRLQVQQMETGVSINSGGAALYQGSGDALRTILRTEGLGGIYKGYAATVAAFGPFSALYFMFYEQVKAISQWLLSEKRRGKGREDGGATSPTTSSEKDRKGGPERDGKVSLSLPVTLANAVAAAAAASWLTNPLDMAKLRLQVERGSIARVRRSSGDCFGSPQVRYRGMLDALAQIYREGGLVGLFRGSGARMAYQAPSTAIAMATFESAREAWGLFLSRK